MRKNIASKDTCKNSRCAFAIADATTLTEAGYVEEDVENILLKLFKQLTVIYKNRKRKSNR